VIAIAERKARICEFMGTLLLIRRGRSVGLYHRQANEPRRR